MNKDYITCEGCGVVLDKTSCALERDDRFNRDQDKIAEHVKCPVCQEWNCIGEWEKWG